MHADITWQNVGAQESLDDKVVLKECDTYDLTTLRSPTDYNMASASTETLQLIEDCAQIWIKQIEQVSYLLWESRIILFLYILIIEQLSDWCALHIDGGEFSINIGYPYSFLLMIMDDFWWKVWK